MEKIVPPPEQETRRSSVELPTWMWERLREIAAQHRHTSSRVWTRDEIIQHFLGWAIREYDESFGKERGKRPK